MSVPTHEKGHQLGVVITKEKALFVSDVQVTDPGLCTNHPTCRRPFCCDLKSETLEAEGKKKNFKS